MQTVAKALLAQGFIAAAILAMPASASAQDFAKAQAAPRHEHAQWLGEGLKSLSLLLPASRRTGASEQSETRR